jgi:hypothetical protein
VANIKDIVLIYHEEEPAVFARIEDVTPDRRKDWYHVKLLFLQIPLKLVTWTLKGEYITGSDFTMGGEKMRLELVKSPESECKNSCQSGCQSEFEARIEKGTDNNYIEEKDYLYDFGSSGKLKANKQGNIIYLYNNDK